MTIEVFCIKDYTFNFTTINPNNPISLEVKSGECRLCDVDQYGYYIHDKTNKNLKYPILIGFEDCFCSKKEWRDRQLTLLNIE